MTLFRKGRDLLSLADLADSELGQVLSFARELKSRGQSGEAMSMMTGAQLFLFDPHRVMPAWNPFGLAMARLGGEAHLIQPDELNIAWGENYLDLFAQLDQVGHGLAMASAQGEQGHPFMSDAAKLMSRPVLNMLSETAAPFQALATLMTLEERCGAELGSAPVCVTWAPPGIAPKPASLAFSLIEALIRRDLDLRLACPATQLPDATFLERMESLVPGALELSPDPVDAIVDAELVFALNWGEPEAEGEKETGAGWTLSTERLELAAPGALVGGGLPQTRDREIEAKLLEDSRSLHLMEGTNLMHIAEAVLALTLDLNLDSPDVDEI